MRKVFDVNVLGAYLVAREAARRMNKSRGGNGGSIVLISSVAARIGAPDTYVDYAGSKAAVDAMALGLSKELGREGVRVNAIRPGVIETEKFTRLTASPNGHIRSALQLRSAARERRRKSPRRLSGS